MLHFIGRYYFFLYNDFPLYCESVGLEISLLSDNLIRLPNGAVDCKYIIRYNRVRRFPKMNMEEKLPKSDPPQVR